MMPPKAKQYLTSEWIFRLGIIALLVEIVSANPRRKSENGWRPPLPPQNLTLLTSGVDGSTGKAWIQIGWQPPPEQQPFYNLNSNEVTSYRDAKPRLPVTRYRITWHHRPSHTGALNGENDEDHQLVDDEHHQNDFFQSEADEESSSVPPNSKLRAASSIHELRKMVHKHQTSFTVDSLEPGEVYTVYLQAFGERENVKLRSVRISRKFRAPLLPPDYKIKNTKSFSNHPADAIGSDEEYGEEDDEEEEDADEIRPTEESEKSIVQNEPASRQQLAVLTPPSSASVFNSILIGTPYYEYGFLKLNVSWKFDDNLFTPSVPVLLKWRPEVCLDQQTSSQPTFQRLQSQQKSDQRKSPGTSSAVAFGASYIVTGLRFACRYALSLEPKFDTAQYSNAAGAPLVAGESDLQPRAAASTHKRRRHSATRQFSYGLDSGRRGFNDDEHNLKRGPRSRRSLTSFSYRRRRTREVVKHFETPSCAEVKVVGDVEPPCLLQSMYSSSVSSGSSSFLSSFSSPKGQPEFQKFQLFNRKMAAPVAQLSPPPPPRDFSCQLTMPSLQPSPTSATCWWREPLLPVPGDEFNSVRALQLRSSWRNSSNNNNFFDEDEPEVLKSRVIGYKLWHALVTHAADLELARAGKRKRRREAPVYMKLLTQDELSFTLASLKPGQTYVVELQTVVAPVAANVLPENGAQHQFLSSPVRRIIHVPSASSFDETRLAAFADDGRATQFQNYGGERSGARSCHSTDVKVFLASLLLWLFFELTERRQRRRC